MDPPDDDDLRAHPNGEPPSQRSAPERSREPSLAAGTTLGRFFVLEQVGVGGMGQVYSAYDPQLDRKVALKCLKAELLGASAAESQARLLREAKAMAKLSHPNVVTVFDVGTVGDQVFLTMEFVQGHTLGEWLRQAQRPWTETLRVLVEAGRGLAAAHAAGLIHRDFKPANVLVRENGRAQVTDFGLARSAYGPADPKDPEAPPSPDTSVDALTRPGVIPGTPAYTSPERHDGAPADARSDQYSFCVTLYEALYGERPHPGSTYPELIRAMREGVIRPPPERSRVPGWLRHTILRGLEVDPQRRFPSMDALLATLVVDVPARRSNRVVGSLVVAGVLAVCGVWVYAERRPDLCTGAPARLAGTWDVAVESELRGGFEGIGKPWTTSAWSRIRPAIDAYARAWIAEHKGACEAAQVRGEQSQAVMDLRMMCLERRRRELHALIRLFSSPDETIAARAQAAVLNLPPVVACGDIEALLATVPLPDDRRARASVDALRDHLADARALLESGKYREAAAAALSRVAVARELRYPPVLAEALYLLGMAQARTGPYKDAHANLLEAAQVAETARHDEIAAAAWTELVIVTGSRLVRHEEALQWHTVASAAVARAGLNRHAVGARLESNVATLHMGAGEFARSLEHLERAQEIYEQVLGRNHPKVATAWFNLSIGLDLVGRREEALAATQRALAIREAILGTDHPELAESLDQLGFRLFRQRRAAEARPYCERAVALGRATGAPPMDLAEYLQNLALIERAEGRYDAAERLLLEAVALREGAVGADHPQVAVAFVNLGEIALDSGRVQKAIGHLAKGHAVLQRAVGSEHPITALSLAKFGRAQSAAGHHAAGERDLRRALAVLEAKQGSEHEWTAEAAAGLGQVLHARRRSREALDPLERASAAAASGVLEPDKAAEVDFALAQALIATGGAEDRAVSLATAVLERTADDVRHEALRARIETWLRRHRRP